VRQVEAETSMNETDLENAVEEWNNVTEITPKFQDQEVGPETHVKELHVSPLVSMDNIIRYLNTKPDMETYLEQVKTNPSRNKRSMRRMLCCLIGQPPNLPPHMRHTVRLIQATALIPFSNEDPIHLAMLRTLYRQFTSTTLDCPRYGSHWEQIGFQGSDPSTDLRGVGLLGLVQAVYLVMTPELLPFSHDVYQLSRDQGHDFPLMVLSLNITKITLHVLRDGLLNKHIKLEEDVWRTFNFYYACLMFHVYNTWKTKNLSIVDCGPLLQQTEASARSQVGALVSQFEKFLTTKYSVAVKQAAREQISKYSDTGAARVNPLRTTQNEE